MARYRWVATALAGALLVGGCSTIEDIFPGLADEDEPVVYTESIPPGPSESYTSPTVSPGTTYAETPTYTQPVTYAGEPTVPMGTPTGTFVGQKVQEILHGLNSLKSTIATRRNHYQQQRDISRRDSQAYYATIAAINARLQLGTTPGNPVLISQWNAAQSELDRVMADIATLNTLSNQVASDSAIAAFLWESVNAAYGLQGAIDEDHRQLAVIEDEINRTVVSIDRLLNGVNGTIRRYTNYINNERHNLTTLSVAIKNGEYLGASLSNRAYAAAYIPPGTTALLESPRLVLDGRPALVIIRFDRPDVEFENALYNAVSRALDQRPASSFDIVAVAPALGNPAEIALGANAAKRNAQKVLQVLSEMGLPSSRVNLSSITSPGALTNEVHVYVR
ncbi:MAG: hypothetical protein V3V17_10155 [Alphaproteobacteria bacterium]